MSIVFFTDSWRPDSFYHKIAANQQMGLHTLCLLDIQVKEPTLESLARGRKVQAALLLHAGCPWSLLTWEAMDRCIGRPGS